MNHTKTRLNSISRLLAQLIFSFSAVYATLSFLLYWDPSRTEILRFRASSPYTFERPNPKFEETDPTTLLSIKSTLELEEKRRKIQELIWGKAGIPQELMPFKVEKDFHMFPKKPPFRPTSDEVKPFVALYDVIEKYTSLRNLSHIERISSGANRDWKAFAGVFFPKISNQRLVIYQNGFASTYHNQWRLIGDLIEKGFTVVAHNFRWYGTNFGSYDLE